jgi:hypothetical protein
MPINKKPTNFLVGQSRNSELRELSTIPRVDMNTYYIIL